MEASIRERSGDVSFGVGIPLGLTSDRAWKSVPRGGGVIDAVVHGTSKVVTVCVNGVDVEISRENT